MCYTTKRKIADCVKHLMRKKEIRKITIQDIMKKNFNFNEGGTIVFGGNPYDATLNLQAVHTVNGVSLSDLNIGIVFQTVTLPVSTV